MKTWEVDGVIWATDRKGDTYPIFKKLVVRYMSDTVGKSLSISDEDHGLMMQVPFNAIEKQIKGGSTK